MPARLLVIGRTGQLAHALARREDARFAVEAMGRDKLDLAARDTLRAALAQMRPNAVINAAAYTAVDKAESEPEAAFALNRDGPAALAKLCAETDTPLIHISTDYVFDGEKPTPYVESDAKSPASVYGRSKSEGEDAVLAHGRAAVLRTSWVYSATGTNFVKTMLRLSQERDELRVVADQTGRPTWAEDLADACLITAQRLIEKDESARGVFHYAGAGDTTWADFAEEIMRATGRAIPVRRITTAEYPLPARRPANSRLDTTKISETLGVRPRDWREALSLCLKEMV